MTIRESFIPATKSELISALTNDGALPAAEREDFGAVCRLIAAIVHHETFDELEGLRDRYRAFDPGDAHAGRGDPVAFLKLFESLLQAASFRELSGEAVNALAETGALQDLKVRTVEAGVSRIRFFWRGARPETVRLRRWWGLYRPQRQTEVFDDVILIIELAPELQDKKEARALARIRRGAQPGSILLKHFGDVPRDDLITLHPGATPAMKRRDQLIIGVPAVAGSIPLLTQIGPAVTVLFAVLAAYFGMEGMKPSADGLKRAIAALSGLVAIGAFVMRQRLKYDRQKLFYQKQLADTVYFHTIANNAGVIDGLVGQAEIQDVKEACLAYFILRSAGPVAKADLDRRAEQWLRGAFAMEVDFEIGDALAKLERMGIVARNGDLYEAAAPAEALARLDALWDGYFQAKRTA